VFEKLGFSLVAKHRSKDVVLFRQGDINFIVNREPASQAAYFTAEHGPSACGMAFRVKDSHKAYKRALALGASTDVLARLVDAARAGRGVRTARQALPHLDGRSRSRPESRIRAAIVLAGLPKPAVNRAVYDRFGGWLAEPDLHYDEGKIALEFNGAEHADVARMRKDSTRLLDLQREGWAVRVYTAPHAYRRLDDVVADVADLLARRAPRLLTPRLRRVTEMPPYESRVSPSLGA